jgi:hypothetical protein
MTLHCAGRLGMLSYLYQNRAQIAHTLGFIAELPIAVCSSDYDSGSGFVFESNDDSTATPPMVLQVNDIHLFITAYFNFQILDRMLLSEFQFYAEQQKLLSRPPQSIFQPPTVS